MVKILREPLKNDGSVSSARFKGSSVIDFSLTPIRWLMTVDLEWLPGRALKIATFSHKQKKKLGFSFYSKKAMRFKENPLPDSWIPRYISFRVKFNVEFPRKVMDFPIEFSIM